MAGDLFFWCWKGLCPTWAAIPQLGSKYCPAYLCILSKIFPWSSKLRRASRHPIHTCRNAQRTPVQLSPRWLPGTLSRKVSLRSIATGLHPREGLTTDYGDQVVNREEKFFCLLIYSSKLASSLFSHIILLSLPSNVNMCLKFRSCWKAGQREVIRVPLFSSMVMRSASKERVWPPVSHSLLANAALQLVCAISLINFCRTYHGRAVKPGKIKGLLRRLSAAKTTTFSSFEPNVKGKGPSKGVTPRSWPPLF